MRYEVAERALDHVVITPEAAALPPGGEQLFTAVGYDAQGNPVPGLTFTWSVTIPEAGSIAQNGLFTASTTPGTFENAIRVEATQDGVTRQAFATVTVTETIGTVSGRVRLQGRTDHSGVTLLLATATQLFSVRTDAAGNFSLSLPEGNYQVEATMPGYLSVASPLVMEAGQAVTLSTANLPGGDVNGDRVVDILDLAKIAAAYGTERDLQGWNAEADINGDGLVNLFDLVLAGLNASLTGPIPWPAQ
jgi:hypothetical protein